MAQWQSHRARAEGITQLAEVVVLVNFREKLHFARQKPLLPCTQKQENRVTRPVMCCS